MQPAPDILTRNHLYEIVLYPQDHILSITWHRPPQTAEFKEGTSRFMEAMEYYQIKKLVSDSSKRGNPMPEDLLWISHEMVPTICAQKVQQLAYVVPTDPHHARSLECCLMTSEVCYELQFFYSLHEAVSWLQGASGKLREKAVA